MEYRGKKIQSVEKVLLLLDCFWQGRTEYALSELAQKTGLAKSTIHGLLGTLMSNDLVEQDDLNGRYRLGYHAFELGCVAQERWHVRSVAAHSMRAITDRTGESLYLGMRCGGHILVIENSESTSDIKFTCPLGSRMPMYGCSQGKMILALMAEKQLQTYLQTITFKRYTSYTITDPEQLKKELNMIRVQGYATEYDELLTGVKSVAAPIYNADGTCDCAISVVTASRGSISGEYFQKLRQLVMQAAEDISRELRQPDGWYGL